jgi:WXG100 family type VII secretion target
MNDEILLKAGDARDAASKVSLAANNAQADFEALKSELSRMNEYFRGRTAAAFQTRYDEWHKNAGELSRALDELGKFLNAAANAIDDVDTQLQGMLGA